MTNELLVLALVLLAAEAGGLIATGLRVPRITGQIVAGVVIGPSVLGVVADTPTVQLLAEIGALCILALAGLETDVTMLRAVCAPALLAAFGGVLLPLGGGIAVSLAYGLDTRAALFVGAILTATSVGITAATLRDLGALQSRAGATILGAAVIDDVLGLVVLGLVVAAAGGGRAAAPVVAIAAMAAIGATSLLVAVAFRGVLARSLRRFEAVGGGLPALLGLVLASAWAYQAIGGLAGITGAYFAGLLLAGSEIGEELRTRLAHAGDAIGAPTFFVAIGLTAQIGSVGPTLPLALALLGVAVVGKVLGSGAGARAGGLDGTEAVTVGLGMVARGEVALVAASTGAASGAIGTAVYSALVLLAVVTTVVTPVLLTAWGRRTERVAPARRRPLAAPAVLSGRAVTVPLEVE